MSLFQAKMGPVRLRKSEKKNRSDQFVPDPEQRIKKNSKKIKKIIKHHYDLISSQNGLGEAVKERKKNYRSDRFLTDQEYRTPKNSNKIQKH